MSTDNWEVGMIHEMCPCCLTEMNHSVIIPQKLSKPVANQIKEMNGKAIGISDEPCKNCKEIIDKGYQLLVGIDPKRSEIDSNGLISFTGAYRTGNIIWLKSEVTKRILSDVPDNPFIFVEDEVFSAIYVEENKTLLDIIKANQI